ncbi:MAG: hypothetical protein LBD90_06265 [Bifidobacteriaceae bacterium]|jgi:hypothetical protein|nr:hypothetical protein [Bifidobacteriaceae bacterium]
MALKQHLARLAAVAVAALALAQTAACAAEPGLALRVGDVAYSEQDIVQIQRNLNRVMEIAGTDGAYTGAIVVQSIVQTERFREVLLELGDAASLEAATALTADAFNDRVDQLGFDEASAQQIKDLGLTQIERDLLLGLGYEAITTALDEGTVTIDEVLRLPANVKVNPRYGVFDDATGSWVDPAAAWTLTEETVEVDPATDSSEVPDTVE